MSFHSSHSVFHGRCSNLGFSGSGSSLTHQASKGATGSGMTTRPAHGLVPEAIG